MLRFLFWPNAAAIVGAGKSSPSLKPGAATPFQAAAFRGLEVPALGVPDQVEEHERAAARLAVVAAGVGPRAVRSKRRVGAGANQMFAATPS